MAAKGLQSLYREVHPELLQKKYRGKNATMGLRSGEIKQMRFGEEEEGGIEGIELLEQYKEEQRQKKRAEQGLNSDGEGAEDTKDEDEDEDGFNSSDWEVDSDDESTDSGGWIDVSSESGDEAPAPKRQRTESEAPELVDDETEKGPKSASLSKLATTSILTPADLAKLQELRRQAKVDKEMGTNAKAKRKRELIAKHIEEGLTAEDIELPATLAKKSTKEERVAKAKEGKPDREEHKSTQAIRKSAQEELHDDAREGQGQE
jgi:protein SDA1